MPEYSFRAEDLIREYDANMEVSDIKYAGKSMRVSGEVLSVGRNSYGEPMVTLVKPPGAMLSVGLYFVPYQAAKIKALVPGAAITVEGTMRRKEYGEIIPVGDCKWVD